MKRWLRTMGPMCVVALAIGCGETRERGQNLRISQLPPKALEAAQKRLPEVSFNSAWMEKEGGQATYEIRGMSKSGKIRDVKVTASGEVLEVD
ncbi:MAG TPA: hypothetical protein VGZ22_20865 [Isosphaeraceae bacterium]|jgi:hypothetical protein|nr:hypothetical protein [Isosphaeraceae bacterium]